MDLTTAVLRADHEPPFAWHPTEREPWDPPAYSNICQSGHETFDATVGTVPVQRCQRCPWLRITDEAPLFDDSVHWPYDPGEIDVQFVELG